MKEGRVGGIFREVTWRNKREGGRKGENNREWRREGGGAEKRGGENCNKCFKKRGGWIGSQGRYRNIGREDRKVIMEIL